MKTTTLKILVAFVTLFLAITQSFSQTYTCTRIDVTSSTFSDQMWVFAIPTTTRSFDNGWDGPKILGGQYAPQIFAWEADNYYQVDAVPTFDSTYIGFRAGQDSVYTLTFTNQLLANQCKNLYLKDLQTDQVIDVYTTGTTYTFTAKHTDEPVKRFILLTTLPGAENTDTASTTPVDTTVTTPVDTVDTTPVDTVSTDPFPTNAKKDKKIKKNSKLLINSAQKTLFIQNLSNERGSVKVYNATSGLLVKEELCNANGTTTITEDLTSGVYIVRVKISNEQITSRIILH